MKKLLSCLALLAAVSSTQATSLVFSDDFDGVLPTQITPGTAALTGVQYYAGLGAPGNQFSGSFLRSETGNVVTLTLSGLPDHRAISLGFLFAAIDSLDGTGSYPQGDFFTVTLDGAQIFRQSFANATADQIQSYVPPANVQLARVLTSVSEVPGAITRTVRMT